jgi:ubiquinone/menaquinone biosynthesis C-methylase UbiE/CRP-like cAMP-binding protein/GNAT superfamily N-acetyltransferase
MQEISEAAGNKRISNQPERGNVMTTYVVQPKSSRDCESIYRFLYEIWSDEFCRSMEGMDHKNRLMKDALDETAHHLIAVDQSGRIVGCVRANILGNTRLPETIDRDLRSADLIELFGSEKVIYGSHFAVAPEARGRTVASLLIAALYHHCLDEGALVGISYCALHYVSFYSQLGYRPYMENFRMDAGIRVPIIHCLRDRNYLTEIKSPLARLCPSALDDEGKAARMMAARFPAFRIPGFSRSKVHHLWARLAHTMPNDATGEKNIFLDGLSEEEQRIVGHRLSEITFSPSDYVYRRGEVEQGLGVLVSGSLGVEVTVDGISRIIHVILPGEPFGEVRSLGGCRRTADLVALDHSQAFLFPFDFLERVSCADTELGLKLTRRLLKILAIRFADLTAAVTQEVDSSAGSVRVHQPSLYQHPNADEIESRIESYRFDSLGDQEGEFKRLITHQATIGEDIEFAVLERVGLQDGATVLDLGSGPGVTSLLMARRLPQAKVMGVEPEDLLRAKAEKLVASQGLAGRCRFLKGTGDRIPLDDNMVDFSYARLLFQHLPNPLEVLSEIKRVTRQGGGVVILDVDDRTNIFHPAPEGMEDLEKRIADAQAAIGGDRHVGRKLYGYMHEIGLQEVDVEHIPITASALGREIFFSIVYSFKRQVLKRAGGLDARSTALFSALEDRIKRPSTFAMTTVFVGHGHVP